MSVHFRHFYDERKPAVSSCDTCRTHNFNLLLDNCEYGGSYDGAEKGMGSWMPQVFSLSIITKIFERNS